MVVFGAIMVICGGEIAVLVAGDVARLELVVAIGGVVGGRGTTAGAVNVERAGATREDEVAVVLVLGIVEEVLAILPEPLIECNRIALLLLLLLLLLILLMLMLLDCLVLVDDDDCCCSNCVPPTANMPMLVMKSNSRVRTSA
jgi:hypothetical protein